MFLEVDIGSPPRVRGIELEDTRERREQRITPACAGNSNVGTPDFLSGEDHPRVCGE